MENNVHTQEFVVEAEQAGERLDRYLTLIYANQSRSFFQKLIKGGNVNVNGKAVTKAGYVLDISDVVTASIPEAQSVAIEAEDIPLNILYEDGKCHYVPLCRQSVRNQWGNPAGNCASHRHGYYRCVDRMQK